MVLAKQQRRSRLADWLIWFAPVAVTSLGAVPQSRARCKHSVRGMRAVHASPLFERPEHEFESVDAVPDPGCLSVHCSQRCVLATLNAAALVVVAAVSATAYSLLWHANHG